MPHTSPDTVQTLAESSSSHAAQTFLETDASLPHHAACTAWAMCCCLCWIYWRCWSGLSQPAQLLAISVVPFCRLAHLEISQILKVLTTFSATSLLNHSPVSIITNSAAAEIPICIYYPVWGVLKMHHGPQLPFPWSTCCNVLRVCQLTKATWFLSSH